MWPQMKSNTGTPQDGCNMAPRWVGRGGKVTVDGHKSRMWAKNYPLKPPRHLKTSLSATAAATATPTPKFQGRADNGRSERMNITLAKDTRKISLVINT